MILKPGCLAEIIGAKVMPENNGRIVTVLRRATADEYIELTSGRKLWTHGTFATNVGWWVSASTPMAVSISNLSTGKQVGIGQTLCRPFKAKWLRPISDPDVDMDGYEITSLSKETV